MPLTPVSCGKVGYELNKEEKGKNKLSAKRWKMSYDIGECKFIHKFKKN